jgi:hypothetical protein
MAGQTVERIRVWMTAKNIAAASLVVVVLGLVRSLGERYRLEAFGPPPTPKTLDGLWIGALGFSVSLLLSLLFYLFGRYRSSIAVAIIGIAGLIVFKLVYLPEL